jgi:hypothetical protein
MLKVLSSPIEGSEEEEGYEDGESKVREEEENEKEKGEKEEVLKGLKALS